jgi:broad specificity phosphatase PhoE
VTRLTLVRHGATGATRRAAFPAGDEPLEPPAVLAARSLAPRLGRWDAAWTSPEPCAVETAKALGLTATIAPALADADPGAWRGRSVSEIERSDPAALAAWMARPDTAPPGGESVLDVIARVAAWLEERAGNGLRVVAVTHALVVRAAVIHALLAPAEAVWRIDVAPLSRTVLHAREGRWTVRGANLGPAGDGDPSPTTT